MSDKQEFVVVSTSLLTHFIVPKRYAFGKPRGSVDKYVPLMFIVPIEQVETLRQNLGNVQTNVSPSFPTYANAYGHMMLLVDMHVRDERQATYQEMVRRPVKEQEENNA